MSGRKDRSKLSRLTSPATALVAYLSSSVVLAASGPLQTPLRVTQMYAANPNGALYVAFQTGAMPAPAVICFQATFSTKNSTPS